MYLFVSLSPPPLSLSLPFHIYTIRFNPVTPWDIDVSAHPKLFTPPPLPIKVGSSFPDQKGLKDSGI